MPWMSWGGFWTCLGCGLQYDRRLPPGTGRWDCQNCGRVIDDGLEFQRALARGDPRLWEQMADEERRTGRIFNRARALQAIVEGES